MDWLSKDKLVEYGQVDGEKTGLWRKDGLADKERIGR